MSSNIFTSIFNSQNLFLRLIVLYKRFPIPYFLADLKPFHLIFKLLDSPHV